MKRLIRQSTMSDEHALVNLDQRFFDNPGSAVSYQKRKRSAVAKPGDRPAQPSERPFPAAVCSLRGRCWRMLAGVRQKSAMLIKCT
jgi:hypothetical protein